MVRSWIKSVAVFITFYLKGSSYIQRCDNCVAAPDCGPVLSETTEYVTSHCNKRCDLVDTCFLATYHSANSSCKLYNCDRIEEATLGFISFRYSNSSECGQFTLRTLPSVTRTALCEIPFSNIHNLSSSSDCVNNCLEEPDCFGTVHYHGQCRLYNCTVQNANHIGVKFNSTSIDLYCNEELERKYIQTCMNCERGSQCQDRFEELLILDAENCSSMCSLTDNCALAEFQSTIKKCRLYDCTLVQESGESMTFRTSPNNDCPFYQISVLEGAAFCTSNLGQHTHIHHLEYCFNICLDTVGCRSVFFDTAGKVCTLQPCDNYIYVPSGFLFAKRHCLDTNVTTRAVDIITITETTPEKATPNHFSTVTLTKFINFLLSSNTISTVDNMTVEVKTPTQATSTIATTSSTSVRTTQDDALQKMTTEILTSTRITARSSTKTESALVEAQYTKVTTTPATVITFAEIPTAFSLRTTMQGHAPTTPANLSLLVNIGVRESLPLEASSASALQPSPCRNSAHSTRVLLSISTAFPLASVVLHMTIG